MGRWEYAATERQSLKQIHELANEWGAKGWEMVGFVVTSRYNEGFATPQYTAMFKRPAP